MGDTSTGDLALQLARRGLLGQPSSPYAKIKDAAAARGIKFGVAVKNSFMANDPAYKALVLSEAALLSADADMQPSSVRPTSTTYDWSRPDAFVATADAAGLPFRFSAGMVYPAHDPAWISTQDANGNITDVGYLNSGNWQSEIDKFMDGWAGRPYAQRFTTINVSNELIDPTQTDGWRRHPWYNAAGGPNWLLYAFQKARQNFPNTPLYLCQDVTEMLGGGPAYYRNLAAFFLAALDWLKANNAPITGVAIQGHLALNRVWDPVAFDAFLSAIKAKGLKIISDEIDVRSGITGTPIGNGAYSAASLDSSHAVRIAQLLDVMIPYITGGELIVWELSDKYNAWSVNERPCIFDTNMAVKPDVYRAFLNALKWSR